MWTSGALRGLSYRAVASLSFLLNNNPPCSNLSAKGHGTSERWRKIDRPQVCSESLEDKLWERGVECFLHNTSGDGEDSGCLVGRKDVGGRDVCVTDSHSWTLAFESVPSC